MSDTPLDLQIISTFDASPIEAPLLSALGEAGIDARIAFTQPAQMSEYMLNAPPDSDRIAGTIVLVRVEDWLRDGFSSGQAGDAWVREELKSRVRDFASEIGILIYRGAPVWFLACPSNGWLADHHKIVPLCRTYTNLLAARLSNTSQAITLTWPQGLSGEDRSADQANNVPFTPECFGKVGEVIAAEVSRTFAAQSPARQTTAAASPELAAYLAGLQVRVELSLARDEDRGHVDRIIRTAASFSLSGEQPNISDHEVISAIASLRCVLVSVTDRMGEHGPSGVILYHERDGALIVAWFSLSCPVLGKQVEYAVVSTLARIAKDRGQSQVIFEYRPSARNQPMKLFLESIGDSESATRFALSVSDADTRINAKAVNAGAWTVTVARLEKMAGSGA
jgi:hypothetical protein